ncbi:MAG: helix-turn-helix domain-containing protein [Hydrogenophaga sp.]|uniref:helix-turn-helix domain-containing protein n=1 Tax=Hydrogenophaga sp. TaxID=1904254 RepID=UPI0026180D0E|nr:helix-turn-helix domain-containing protein [Hydrogenophaga sp.]MDD3784402.1 helix-turn-helix domain-containing protein [Hydrogenophaga sp.]MDX9968103.1 helix-turn-helix domain-containing protein [Hydrogenophaga sp.]
MARTGPHLLLALRRIAEGERIIDIALDCGYASQSAFSAMFRRHFGTPPSAQSNCKERSFRRERSGR